MSIFLRKGIKRKITQGKEKFSKKKFLCGFCQKFSSLMQKNKFSYNLGLFSYDV